MYVLAEDIHMYVYMYVLGAEEKLFWEETYVLCSAVSWFVSQPV